MRNVSVSVDAGTQREQAYQLTCVLGSASPVEGLPCADGAGCCEGFGDEGVFGGGFGVSAGCGDGLEGGILEELARPGG